MIMTYQELINNIRDLGFSDDPEIEEFEDLIPNSINRAITEINLEVDPIIEKLEIDITDDVTGYLYINMNDVETETFIGDGETTSFSLKKEPRSIVSVAVGEELIENYTLNGNVVSFETAPDGEVFISYMVFGDENFLSFADTPVLFEQNGSQLYSRFNDYEIETGNTIIINTENHKGKYRIFYKKAHENFTNTEEEKATELPLRLRVHHLVPLLASYYVWLEDEPTKAAQYYNLYEQKKAMFTEENNRPRMRVLDGGM